MSDIRKKIKEFTDEFLIEQFLTKQHEYTPEAVSFLEEEIAVRHLREKYKDTFLQEETTAGDEEKHLDEELIPFEHAFNQVNIMLARSLLVEEKIPVIITASSSSSAIPLETEASKLYTIRVPQSLFEKATACIGAIFHVSNSQYVPRYSDTKERLRSFSAHEANPEGEEPGEEITVVFTPDESVQIAQYIQRLLAEADTIEENGRTIFYFDNLQECHNHVREWKRSQYSRTDLFTIIEVLQIYCDDPEFPPALEKTAEALIDFLSA